MRFALPSQFEEFPHTADLGIAVEGATSEEAVARAILAMGQLLAGGSDIAPVEKRTVRASGEDAAGLLVDALRQCLLPFFTERLVACAVDARSMGETRWEAEVEFGPYESGRHEGADIKAATYAAARLERRGSLWVATAVFDV